jgi:hypothetical protein
MIRYADASMWEEHTSAGGTQLARRIEFAADFP